VVQKDWNEDLGSSRREPFCSEMVVHPYTVGKSLGAPRGGYGKQARVFLQFDVENRKRACLLLPLSQLFENPSTTPRTSIQPGGMDLRVIRAGKPTTGKRLRLRRFRIDGYILPFGRFGVEQPANRSEADPTIPPVFDALAAHQAAGLKGTTRAATRAGLRPHACPGGAAGGPR